MAFPPTLFKTYTTGETLTASDLNSSLADISSTNIPEDTDDYSVNVAEMQTTTDPYPAATESLATTLAGELERVRFLLTQVTGEANWYVDPDRSIASIATLLGTSTTVASFPNGSEALPSISFASDPDTGFRRPSADQLRVVIGGVDIVDFTATAIRASDDGVQNIGTATNRFNIIFMDDGTVSAPSYSFSDTNTGMYHSGADELAFTTGGIQALVLDTNQRILGNSGTNSLPAFTFIGDTNSGLYRIGADNVGIATGGVNILDLDQTSADISVPVKTAAGTVGAPSYSFGVAGNKGMYSSATNDLSFATAGTIGLTLTSTQRLHHVAGTNGTPAISFIGDPDTGWFNGGANALNAAAGGTNIGAFTSTGLQLNVGSMKIPDGITAPGSSSGLAKIYVDSADGDLKVVFGNGFVAVIAADS